MADPIPPPLQLSPEKSPTKIQPLATDSKPNAKSPEKSPIKIKSLPEDSKPNVIATKKISTSKQSTTTNPSVMVTKGLSTSRESTTTNPPLLLSQPSEEIPEKIKPFPADPKPIDTKGLSAPRESIDESRVRQQLADTERMNAQCEEALQRNRRPPATDSKFGNLFYKGPMGPQAKKMSMKEKMKAFWLTKQMTDEIDDMELRLRVTLSELVLFVLYIIVLGIVIYGDHTYSSFLMTNSLRRQFVQAKFPTSADVPISFQEIKSAADVWNYYEKGFVDSLYWEQYYHHSHTGGAINAEDKNVLYENILIGLPRIRMIRVRSDSCHVHPSFRRQFVSCFSYYSPKAEDRDPIPNKLDKQNNYYWSDGRGDGNGKYWGIFGRYGEGGYSVYLPRSHASAKSMFQAMKDSNWITRGTRAIFIDFSVFNTQVNLFCAIKIVVEFPPSGGAYPSYHFKTTKLFPYITQFDYFVGGAEMTFVFLVLFHLIEEIREMAYFGIRYFLSFANYVDLIQVLAAFYSIAFLTIRAMSYNNAIIGLIRSTKDSYVNFDEYMYWQWLYTKCTAILFFLAIVKLFKYMQFTAQMAQVTYIVRRSAKDVMGFLVMFIVVFLAFTQLGYLLFGTQVSHFRSYTESAFTLFKLLLGQFDYMQLEQADRVLGPLFFLCYVFFLFFILLNMFLAIMNETYSTARTGKTLGDYPERVLMEEYLRRGFWNIFSCLEPPNKMSIDRSRCKKTVKEIKHALLRNNFTIVEINMFLAKYGIDGKREVDSSDIRKILKDFEKKGYFPTQPPKLEELNLKGRGRDEQSLLRKMDVGWTGLTIKDFDELLARLEYIEMQVDKMAARLSIVIEMLERTEKSLWSNKKYEVNKEIGMNMPC